ncbi:DoxX family protein [Lipingzhangella sp. LS1_29]|uniref:DoxX family protein n=1 Tax=Lipingzhangella rawalii TaxID=2055835 RepID=A0ABU2H5F1_9ACTN|nr:DoxX family protein [Lipingzhangella rawalii]MDS1270538.1 DoxX family protein [Lipingzhangella rawalii]
MELGLLLLRLLLAALLIGHSTQKLFGWFGGTGTAQIFDTWGFTPGARMVVLAGALELAGAVSIAAGFLLPGGAAVVIGTMIVASVATAPNGFWAQRGGCEVPFCYGALALILTVTGPGPWSVDHALGLSTGLSGPLWGLIVLLVGSAAALPPLYRRRRVLKARAQSTAR